MTDARLYWFDYGGDIQLEDGDIALDNGLQTAILVSLFTDGRAPEDAILPGNDTSRRGVWTDSDTDKQGSLLWLLAREKVTADISAKANLFCKDALNWLIEDGIASTVNVETQIAPLYGLQIKIQIERGSNREYDYLWQGQSESAGVTIGKTSVNIEFI